MNNKEAANTIKVIRKTIAAEVFQVPSTLPVNVALRMAEKALRGPQPDYETGLVPCGKCHQAKMIEYDYYLYQESENKIHNYAVECFCVRAMLRIDKEKAKTLWNESHGWRASE